MARKRAREIVEDRVDRERRVEGAGQNSSVHAPSPRPCGERVGVRGPIREFWRLKCGDSPHPALRADLSPQERGEVRKASLPRLGPPPDTLIGKPERGHVLSAVDITE